MFVKFMVHAEKKDVYIEVINYEVMSLVPEFESLAFHKAVVARFKRGLLSREQRTEKFRHMILYVQNFIDIGALCLFIFRPDAFAPIFITERHIKLLD